MKTTGRKATTFLTSKAIHEVGSQQQAGQINWPVPQDVENVMRYVVGLVIGLLAGISFVAIVQVISGQIYPPPANLDWENRQQVDEMIAAMPLGAWVLLYVSEVGGAFVAGLVCGSIARARWFLGLFVIGCFFSLFGLLNMLSFRHPGTYVVLSLVAYIPMAVWGGQLGAKLFPQKAVPDAVNNQTGDDAV